MLSISEIFSSIQGEGPQAGTPAIFLRTAGCNFRCSWCDTPYALESRQGKQLSPEEVLEQIQSFGSQHLVVTGGEPMIQQEGLKEVLKELDGYFVEIETNGFFESLIDEYVDQYNCSPKLPSSGNKAYELKLLPNNKTWYKFVVGNEDELEETLDYIEQNKLPQKRIQLMPLGENEEELKERSPWLVEKCKKHGFRFTPRVHVMLWGNTVGT